jgi:ELWxxDGT repeat protein
VQVKDVDPRAGISSFPDALTVLGGQVLFTAEDGVHGREVWTTRGTAPTTQLVLDVNPGAAHGTVRDLGLGAHPVGGRLLYAGNDAFGLEPWVTDGTAAGTHRVGNLAPGDSRPHDLGVLGNTVVLGASDGATERLYSWTAVGSTVTVTPQKRYSAKQARKKKVVVPVTVTSSLGTALSGGRVVLTRKGKAIGTAALSNGVAQVRITVRLRPGRAHQVVATWAGDLVAAGSASTPTKLKIKIKRKHR